MTPEEMQKRIEDLEYIINQFVKPDKYLFQRDIEFLNTHIGRSSTSRLGFYGFTPAVQPSSTGETSGASAVNLTNATTFTGNFGTTAYTVLDIVKHLKTIGIILK